MVEHGLDALLADRGGRDLEAQTSLKRGALNLRHSREAAARLRKEIEGTTPADLLAPPRQTRSAPGGPVQPTYVVDGEGDADAP